MDELDAFLAKNYLSYVVTDQNSYSDQLPPFSVCQQFPLPGSFVKKNRKIYVTLNAEAPLSVSMPNLMEGSIRQAKLLLTNKGLKLGHVSDVPDLAKHAVLEQWYNGKPILPGKLIRQGEAIDVVVGEGLGEQLIQVPNVLSMSLEEAELVLLEYGMRIKMVHYVPNSEMAIGTVCQQDPMAGVQVKMGTIMSLWVVDSTVSN